MAEAVISSFLCAALMSQNAQKKHLWKLSLFYFVAIVPCFVSCDKRILIKIARSEKTAAKSLTAGSHSSGTEAVTGFEALVWGKLMELGRESDTNGKLHLLPSNCDNDESSFARLPGGWVAVLNYTEKITDVPDSGTVGNCPGVIDRMKRALVFGASAIIILTMNPKIIKEKFSIVPDVHLGSSSTVQVGIFIKITLAVYVMSQVAVSVFGPQMMQKQIPVTDLIYTIKLDMTQIFSKPVTLIDLAENITNMLHLLSSKMKLKARFLFDITHNFQESQKFFTTVTLWGTCGRYSGRSYHEWDGVVCLGQQESANVEGKADQENFWNYFYTGILILIMVQYLRTRRGRDWDDQDYIDGSLRQLAYQALAVMKIKRYSKDGSNDTCAICLENFFLKQKLRVLPCGHYFHTKCVDPWLVRSHTCPLCKLNIFDKLESLPEEN